MRDLDRAQRLCGSDVHVWVVNTETSAACIRELSSTLSRDEKDRADSFKFDYLQRRFCVTRGLLRFFLGTYLATPPHEVEFSYGKRGKPFVAAPNEFQFNLAHCDDLTVYGFAFGCELGIDVERIRDIEDIGAISRHFFCNEEAADLERVEFPKRLDSFFACWTRKEAYIKATGEGLSASLDSFRVAFRPNETPRFMHIGNSASEARLWSLYNMSPRDGYAGALAFRSMRSLRVCPAQPLEQLLRQMADPNSFVDRSLVGCSVSEPLLATAEVDTEASNFGIT
mgnify:CR=1 FL=1